MRGRCKVCGCTEVHPCDPPCGWSQIEPDLCTSCEDAADTLVFWALGAQRVNRRGLMRLFEERLRLTLDVPPLPKRGRKAA